jgi:hypothetical protein
MLVSSENYKSKENKFSSSIWCEIKPDIEISLYLISLFLKIKGYLFPIVSNFCSNITSLNDDIFGLYLIFSYRSESDKNIYSKSTKAVPIILSLLE